MRVGQHGDISYSVKMSSTARLQSGVLPQFELPHRQHQAKMTKSGSRTPIVERVVQSFARCSCPLFRWTDKLVF